MPVKKQLSSLWLFFSFSIVAGIASLVPGVTSRLDQLHFFTLRVDYLTHALCMFVLVVLLAFSLRNVQNLPGNHPLVILAPVLLLSVGITQEFAQKFIPWRVFNWNDIFSECIGVATAYPFYLFITRFRNKAAC